MNTTLKEILAERVLVLDGAMGTMIQSYALSEEDFRGELYASLPGLLKGNNDLLNLTRPDVIEDIHRKYLTAGADIIETNTFNAQCISQADYGTETLVAEMNTAAVRIARKVADEYSALTPDKPRFVVASVGPTNKTLSISPDVDNPAIRNLTFDELANAYIEQMTALLQAGVDAILIETIFDTLNAKAAIYAAEESMSLVGIRVPLMLSVTIADRTGRMLAGQTLPAFLASVSHADILSVGLNCSFGAAEMKPFLRILADIAPYYISAHPNAGLPNTFGQYDQSPEEMSAQISEYVNEGLVNIIGGCCGTTDRYIALYNDIVSDAKPHKPQVKPTHLVLSGLEPLPITPALPFVKVGERCNVAGSRKFLRLIKDKQYDDALAIARKQIEDGAHVIDINMDDGLLDARTEMQTFLNMLASDPDVSLVPVMIDSSDWEVVRAGLKCVQGKCIVNSISLKEGEAKFLSRAREIQRYGAAVVVMAFDEVGQATTYERKIEVCQRAYNLLVSKVGFPASDIIFDPNVLAVATGMVEHSAYGMDFIRATEWIRNNLTGAHVSGGISNLSFSFRGNNYIREAMHSVFLHHTVACGQDFGIVNPVCKVTYSDIPRDVLCAIDDVLLNRTAEATDTLIQIANRKKAEQESLKSIAENFTPESKGNDVMPETVEQRLQNALIRGVGDNLKADLDEALQKYENPVRIIEGPLMDAINVVGELFGEGRMFLPQVVKTARTMKQAVGILRPHIEASRTATMKSAGKVLLATVKGDVHDIGKNIVNVVMACNNYEVIDLGVMVPPEEIVAKAISEHVDMIGLSGLITPSLEEMIVVARMLEEHGVNIPVMIGGATTSELHTALRIAPVYSGPVVWMKDASQNVLAASQLLNEQLRADYIDSLHDRYVALRRDAGVQNRETLTYAESVKLKPSLF